MKFIQAANAQSAPVPAIVSFPSKLSIVQQCSKCSNIVCRDCMGMYHGAYFCDECANLLQPDRYNADFMSIISAGDRMCTQETSLSLTRAARRRVVLIEDDLGDVVYSSLNWSQLLSGCPQQGSATTDFLPVEISLPHRKLHRESVRSRTQRDCLHTLSGEHWDCHILPYTVEEEVFTLTLFQRTSS
jgi:hypothetical protein